MGGQVQAVTAPVRAHPAAARRDEVDGLHPDQCEAFLHDLKLATTSMKICDRTACDLTRGVQTLAARIRSLLQGCRRPTVASGLWGTAPRDATCRSRLSATTSGLPAWSPVIVEVIGVDQRSPPDFGPSCPHDPGLATQATTVDKLDVCPAGAALCWWNRAHPHTRGARPLSKGGSQVLPRRRAASRSGRAE